MRNLDELRIRQLDRALEQVSRMHRQPPHGGWVRTIRQALGMPLSHLANRLGVAPQSVAALELRERTGSVTLKALRDAANALDADLVYAIVPRQSIEQMVQARAEVVASRAVDRVSHSMALEDQTVSERERRRQRRLLVEAMLRNRRRGLWKDPE